MPFTVQAARNQPLPSYPECPSVELVEYFDSSVPLARTYDVRRWPCIAVIGACSTVPFIRPPSRLLPNCWLGWYTYVQSVSRGVVRRVFPSSCPSGHPAPAALSFGAIPSSASDDVARLSCPLTPTHATLSLVAGRCLVVLLVVVVVLVRQEEVLVAAVGGEGDGGDAQAGERALKPVEPREDTLVSPGLTVHAPIGSANRGR